MSLAKGTRLGPYEVTSPLGAGGMGEVYRARDSRLGRNVAVKLLSERFAEDPERVLRFEREARAASALSHANVVAVYDIGREGKSTYIVTEIVEGGTLRDLLDSGALPLRRALDLATQIASGLSAAHEQGVVHRDLKPENILLTKPGDPKIADFGLAKLTETADGIDSQLPTRDNLNTSDGVVMGTVAYMSPEQASGRRLDFRSDQFAFGSILYEMLAGRPAFRRNTAAETLSAIIRDEPEPVAAINSSVPPPLSWILERCLAKNPDDRYASTRDLARELSHVREHLSDLTRGRIAVMVPAATSSGRRARLPWIIAGIAVVVAAAMILRSRRSPREAGPVIRFTMPPPAAAKFFSRFDAVGLAVSPDGSRIAFICKRQESIREVAPAGGPPTMIWIRSLSEVEPKALPGTEGASSLFWSPDGRSIGFFAERRLKRMDIGAGSSVPICDVPPGREMAGTWGSGEIVFASTFEGVLYRVAAEGNGSPAPFVRPEAARNETRLIWPHFLPDGRSFLYVAMHKDGSSELMRGSLTAGPPSQIAPISSRFEYADPGYLVFAQDGGLVAQRFDAKACQLSGPLHSVAPAVYYFSTSRWAGFALSRTGTLVYEPRGNVTRLAWFDRAGRMLEEIGAPDAGETIGLSISPDGKTALFDRTRLDLGTYDIWTIDLARGGESRLTSDPNTEFDPVWLPDGKHIVYSVVRDHLPQLVRRELAGGPEEPLLPPGSFQEALGATADGRSLLFYQIGEEAISGIWALSLSGKSKPEPVVVSKGVQEIGRLSPDGKFVAFISDDSGQPEAYLEEFNSHPERIRLSTGGATLLRWSRDGREIFYTTPDHRLFAVSVALSPSPRVGTPTPLFSLPEEGWTAFDVSSDGRFLAAVDKVSFATTPLTVVSNWISDIKP